MGLQALMLFALISCAAAAPWRCYSTCDGSTVCFGEAGQPCINPPAICIGRPSPPCTGSATVYTPCQCPCPPPSPPPPCPCPCQPPCPDPCPHHPPALATKICINQKVLEDKFGIGQRKVP
ncbi:late cornified envelope-like proline-rich protein 1 [Trichoplusia ni]|uniref:Late cornified envelope-like proline-rich protein 1 n=1 Tax=Trichoplusia ni TaxID=7111 RepID=A0A7E5X2X6_TRINI|nr:late cornified envelope-like proline-rich protein 1 [Trichoplusia ni]